MRRRLRVSGRPADLAGQAAKAARTVEWLHSASRHRHVSPVDFAIAYLGIGDRESAQALLETHCTISTSRTTGLWSLRLV